jgi:hypothetical protein
MNPVQKFVLLQSGDDESNSASDIDLDKLAQALEQATTLASYSKKQNRTKHPKKIAKIPIAKKMIYDSTAPGYKLFKSLFFRIFSLLFHKIFSLHSRLGACMCITLHFAVHYCYII